MDQLTLFETKPVRTRRRTVHPQGAARWSKYNQAKARKPHQCDYCLLDCHADAMAPIPRRARYQRKDGSTTWYLCLSHANDQRVADGLKSFAGAT